MQLSTKGHVTGDIGRLLSPVFHLKQTASLTFYLYFRSHPLDVDSSFSLRLKTGGYVITQPLLSLTASSGSHRRWIQHSVCLPEGSFQVVFEAVLGEIYHTAVAVDQVELKRDSTCGGKIYTVVFNVLEYGL